MSPNVLYMVLSLFTTQRAREVARGAAGGRGRAR